MGNHIINRDGRIEDFNVDKFSDAIYKAALAAGGDNKVLATELALKVAQRLDDTYKDLAPTIEQIQDMVEKVLIDEQHAKTAVAYIRYREARKKARDTNALIAQTEELFADYLSEEAWEVKENANMQKSVNGLNNYVRESFTKKYWLYNIYPEEVRVAHEA